MFVQRLSPDGTETLLDRHSTAFDEWLREELLFRWGSFSEMSHFLTTVTLLDQLNVDPAGFDWQVLSVLVENKWITEGLISVAHTLSKPVRLFDGTKSQVAYLRVVSKFLMDRQRAGDFCVDSSAYTKLTMRLLDILPGR